MTMPLSDHLLTVADLVGRPGSSRQLDLALGVPDGLELPLAEVLEPVRVRGRIESVVDGLLVRARVEATVDVACARCLQPVTDEIHTDVTELFVDPETTDDEVEEGYELHDVHLDLATLLRDALAGAVPLQPLCRPDCRGLCATCGVDRNEATCDCHDEVVDVRWTALRGLSLPDDSEHTAG